MATKILNRYMDIVRAEMFKASYQHKHIKTFVRNFYYDSQGMDSKGMKTYIFMQSNIKNVDHTLRLRIFVPAATSNNKEENAIFVHVRLRKIKDKVPQAWSDWYNVGFSFRRGSPRDGFMIINSIIQRTKKKKSILLYENLMQFIRNLERIHKPSEQTEEYDFSKNESKPMAIFAFHKLCLN